MSLLSGVLPRMEALSTGEMPDTVTIHRPGVATANEYGAMVPGSPAETLTTGRITALDASDVETLVSGEMQQSGLEKLTVPRDVDIRGTDTVTVESDRHGTTTVYTVEGLIPLGTFAVHRKVLVRRV